MTKLYRETGKKPNNYEDVIKDIKEAIALGGKRIEISKDNETPLWIALVKDDQGVYMGYTVGIDNKDFFYELFEYCFIDKIPIKICVN